MCPNCGKSSFAKFSVLIVGLIMLGFWGTDSYASKGKVDNSVVVVFETYEQLHSAFMNYEGASVEASAAKLKQAIEKVKHKEISKLLSFSKTKLDEIKATAEREANNENFHLVSLALIYIVNKYDVGEAYKAYSCPMVKKKWIQNSKNMAKVNNPYAPSMPHCGSQE